MFLKLKRDVLITWNNLPQLKLKEKVVRLFSHFFGGLLVFPRIAWVLRPMPAGHRQHAWGEKGARLPELPVATCPPVTMMTRTRRRRVCLLHVNVGAEQACLCSGNFRVTENRLPILQTKAAKAQKRQGLPALFEERAGG